MNNVINLAGDVVEDIQNKFVDRLEIALAHAKSNKIRGMVITMIDLNGTERIWVADHTTSYYELIGALHVTMDLLKEHHQCES